MVVENWFDDDFTEKVVENQVGVGTDFFTESFVGVLTGIVLESSPELSFCAVDRIVFVVVDNVPCPV